MVEVGRRVEKYESRDQSEYKGDMAKTKIRGEEVQIKQGQGTIVMINKDTYTGGFRNGKIHG